MPGRKPIVRLLLEDGRAVRHNIRTGIQDNANIEVLSDLPDGRR